MLTVTEKALDVIQEFIKQKKPGAAIRITMSIGWSGPALGMALDEPMDGDEVFEKKGTKFVMEKYVWDQAQPINIDFVETPQGSGFRMTSALSAQASGGCGSGCSC